MENHSLESIYRYHHERNRHPDFVIFSKERGEFFRKNIGSGKNILDIGCRDGSLTRYYLEGNAITGIDIDKKALEKARALGIKAQYLDLNDSWDILGEEKFDIVIAAEVMEHLYFPEIVLRKIKKVLKPAGILLGSVPNAFSFKNRLRLLLGQKKEYYPSGSNAY